MPEGHWWTAHARGVLGAVLTAFGLVLVAELGDKTQLAVLSLASQHGAPWLVFAGGAAALEHGRDRLAVGLALGGLHDLAREEALHPLAVAFVVAGELVHAATTARQVPAKAERTRLRVTRPPVVPLDPSDRHCIQLNNAEGAAGIIKKRKPHSVPGTSSGWTTE